MKIAIYNKKGGVGKTTISYFLALLLDMKTITNNQSKLVKYDKNEYLEEVHFKDNDENVIYDLGGWVDKNTLNILKKVDLVFIPFDNDYSSLLNTYSLIKELQKLNISFKTIQNRYKDNSILDENNEYDIPVDLYIKENRLMEYVIQNNIKDLDHLSKKDKYIYRNTIKELKPIIEGLKKWKKN